MSPMPANRREDVWKRIDRRGPDECWPFVGSVNTYGYGQIHINGKQMLAHRLAYELATGSDPGELFVCHICDNPGCCNPAHLFVGTNRDNVLDAVAKGRHSHGERSPAAILTADQVREIRILHAAGRPFVSIARRFAVTPENVSMICRRMTWKHVA